MKVLVHIPSRGRAVELSGAVDRWHAAIADHENTKILVTLDADDVGPHHVDLAKCEVLVGKHKDKVEAINADLDVFPWDVLVVASDDLTPHVAGMDGAVDQAIRTDFANEADDLDAVFWYPDQNSRICCHPVIGRRYYQRDGYVFHPSYRAYYCDDELTMVAQKRGKLYRSTAIKWEHSHPNYRKRKPDATDARAKEHMQRDYTNFARRMGQGFPK